MAKWIIYTVTLGFAVYWASNLLLWIPWSYSPGLGIALMFTLSPFLWAYTVFLALRTYPGPSLIRSASITAFIFLFLAALLDYLFFGLIRNAIQELYHPTTFYGYGFLVILPFILVLVFKDRIGKLRRSAANSDILKAAISGIAFLSILTLMIRAGVGF